jgi:MoxR-like ATPase
MRAELVLQTIKDLFPIKRPLSIIGKPGGGKTSLVRTAAQQMAIGYIEKHMPTMLVEDFGIPDMASQGESFGYKLPDWYPAEGRTDIPDEGILLFDDRNQAGNDLQKVLANIEQARTLHGHVRF